jgi:hypothetical protein
MEAMGYVLLYLLHGKLPWQCLPSSTKLEKYTAIAAMKRELPLTDLCKDAPDAFRALIEACRALRFGDTPPYARLKEMFLPLIVT